jgi:hypothetical protein
MTILKIVIVLIAEPPALASRADARLALEMIPGVYASHFAGGVRMPIPFKE